MTQAPHPTPGKPLSEEDVKLLLRGDVLRHETLGQCVLVGGGGDHAYVQIEGRPQEREAWAWSRFTFVSRPTPADTDGWIEWTGGENPVPGEMVDVRLGENAFHENTDSDSWDWVEKVLPVTAYRIVRPTPVGGDHSSSPQEAIPTERTDSLLVIAADVRRLCNGHPHAKIAWPHRALHDIADRLEALSPSPANGTGWPSREAIEDAVKVAMNDAWADICSDSGCFPADIHRVGRGPLRLEYRPAVWTDLTAGMAASVILALFPPPPVIPDDQGAV